MPSQEFSIDFLRKFMKQLKTMAVFFVEGVSSRDENFISPRTPYPLLANAHVLFAFVIRVIIVAQGEWG